MKRLRLDARLTLADAAKGLGMSRQTLSIKEKEFTGAEAGTYWTVAYKRLLADLAKT